MPVITPKSPRTKRSRTPSTKRPADSGHTHTHLLAVSGKRPAILTSTIWALAHLTPPIVPDRITVLTTATGREAIRRELFSVPAPGKPCVWDALRDALVKEGLDVTERLRFGVTGEDLRVFTIPGEGNRTVELEDLRSAEHFSTAADLLLDVLRSLTEVDDTRLIASVSGGRKPLASLLLGALSLLGRPQDILVHALINEPFEKPSLRPPLYFPSQPAIDHHYFDDASGRELTVSSAAAKPELAEVPYVRLRSLFAAKPELYRSRYSALVRSYDNRVTEMSGPTKVGFDDDAGTLAINGRPIKLRGREYPFFAFIHYRWQKGEAPLSSHSSAYKPLREFLAGWSQRHPSFNLEHDDSDWKETADISDIARMLNALRKRLCDLGLATAAERLFPRGGPVGIPLSQEVVSSRFVN